MKIYEIRVKRIVVNESKSLDQFYANKSDAQKVVDNLNKLMNMYFVREITVL